MVWEGVVSFVCVCMCIYVRVRRFSWLKWHLCFLLSRCASLRAPDMSIPYAQYDCGHVFYARNLTEQQAYQVGSPFSVWATFHRPQRHSVTISIQALVGASQNIDSHFNERIALRYSSSCRSVIMLIDGVAQAAVLQEVGACWPSFSLTDAPGLYTHCTVVGAF